MENESGTQTVESINSRISELRQSPPAEIHQQKEYNSKLSTLYEQRGGLTDATASAVKESNANTAGTGNKTLGEIDGRIDAIRRDPAYNNRFENGAEKKALKKELEQLYQQRGELDDGKFNIKKKETMNSNMGNLTEQAQLELDQLKGLGMDVSDEDLSNITQHEVDGYKRVRQIEQGDFKNLSAPMSKAAKDAGYSTPEVFALRGFLATRFSGNNNLKKKILRVISEDIYNSKGA